MTPHLYLIIHKYSHMRHILNREYKRSTKKYVDTISVNCRAYNYRRLLERLNSRHYTGIIRSTRSDSPVLSRNYISTFPIRNKVFRY